MAFQIVDSVPIKTLANFVHGQDMAVPLGRLTYHDSEGHFFGVDDTFGYPVVFRAYWDPEANPAVTLRANRLTSAYLGYVQFMTIQYQGRNIPPGVFGGPLAGHQVYAPPEQGSDSHRARTPFVDFMGPSDAIVRLGDPAKQPFFALNTVLTRNVGNINELAKYLPMSNGSLLKATRSRVDGDALGTSIIGEIPTSLLTPEDFRNLIRNIPLYRRIDAPANVIAERGAENVALDAMRKNGQLLHGITNAQLTARAIGTHVLIGVPDNEEMPTQLCISEAADGGGVEIRLLRYHELASAERSAVEASFRRMSEHLRVYAPYEAETTASGRGAGGLGGAFRDPWSRIVEFSYHTIVMGQAIGDRMPPITGFDWTARMKLYPDEQILALDEIRYKGTTSFDVTPALDAYRAEISRVEALPIASRPHIDTSYFTLAAIQRGQFGGARELELKDSEQ